MNFIDTYNEFNKSTFISSDSLDKFHSFGKIHNSETLSCKIRLDLINRTDKYEERNEMSFKNGEDISPTVNIFRYKFCDSFTNELYKFSKVHQYDERKQFKEAWNIWVEENDDIVTSEMRRLLNLGYQGDTMDKMYKSARYYFRKKNPVKNDPKPRKNYISVDKDLLNAMDEHINNNIKSEDFKPSDAFDQFCKEYIDVLKSSVSILCQHGMTDSNEIKEKIKKTYKNRYFLVIS
jgi:hypothetical protein